MGVETGVCEGGRKLSSPLTRVSVESFHSMKIINHIPLTSRSHSRSHIPSHQRSSNQREITFKNKNEKSEDYSKADLKQRVLFFITIFRLAIPAFFRFTDVTELM